MAITPSRPRRHAEAITSSGGASNTALKRTFAWGLRCTTRCSTSRRSSKRDFAQVVTRAIRDVEEVIDDVARCARCRRRPAAPGSRPARRSPGMTISPSYQPSGRSMDSRAWTSAGSLCVQSLPFRVTSWMLPGLGAREHAVAIELDLVEPVVRVLRRLVHQRGELGWQLRRAALPCGRRPAGRTAAIAPRSDCGSPGGRPVDRPVPSRCRASHRPR